MVQWDFPSGVDILRPQNIKADWLSVCTDCVHVYAS